VTFRVLDFFLPLMLATLMFGVRELRLLARRAPLRDGWIGLHRSSGQ
jgi:hypothetical protein